MQTSAHQHPLIVTKAAVHLDIAPNGDGDNYYENAARLYGPGRSASIVRGQDWKHVVQSAANIAQALGLNVQVAVIDSEFVVHAERRPVSTAAIEEATRLGRERFFDFLAIKVA